MAVIYGAGASIPTNNSLYTTGKILKTVRQRFALPPNVAVGDKFILARGLSFDSRILSVKVQHAAISGASVNTLGFYRYSEEATVKGATVDTENPNIDLMEIEEGSGITEEAKEILGTISFTTARPIAAELLGSLTMEKFTQNVGELVGLSSGRDTAGGVALVWESGAAFSPTPNTLVHFIVEIDPATQG